VRRHGVTYDTGFFPGGGTSRPSFDGAQAREDLRVVADELHCDAVRITGGDLDRIEVAAKHALDLGLEVWFAPLPCELTTDAVEDLVADAGRRAERLRRDAGARVVLVVGGELSAYATGFLPGRDVYARLAALRDPPPELFASFEDSVRRLNAFLGRCAGRARDGFDGPVTYAAGLWEDVDWAPFDVVGVDAYWDAVVAPTFRDELRARRVIGKPVAVTEFGCCTFHGATQLGALGWSVVSRRGDDRRVTGGHVRDEHEQARHLTEMFGLFDEEGVDTAFWFTFANYDKPRRDDPARDLDLGSYGVLAVEAGDGGTPTRYVRKEAFDALARVGG
jgi:hypothetical protein